MPEEVAKQESCPDFYPEDTAGNGCPAVAAVTPQPQIAENRDEVSGTQTAAAGATMRRGEEDDGLSGRQAVNTDIKEAGHHHAQHNEKDYAQTKHIAIYFACIVGDSQYGIVYKAIRKRETYKKPCVKGCLREGC